jgi:hypothetical protein
MESFMRRVALSKKVSGVYDGSKPNVAMLVGQKPEIIGVAGFTVHSGGGLEPSAIYPALAEGDLFQAGDFQSLALLDHGHELGGVGEGIWRAGIQPSGAAAEFFNPQGTAFEVEPI